LDQPTITDIRQGNPGQLLASVKSVKKAKHYDVRSGQVGPNGATPTAWVTQTIPNAKTAVPINGLMPGITYAIQVRAYGKLGYTEWSDSATRMCI
jgi:Fibronectin type III domain